jgi:hypothetical protein
MRTHALIVVLGSVGALSCIETTASTEALAPLSETTLLRSPGGESPLETELEVEDGIVRGHVEWAPTCRRVVQVRERSRGVEQRKPSYPAAAMAGGLAVGVGTGGLTLLDHLDDFSAEVTCDSDENGEESCSSPRETAAVGGVLLVGTAIALAAASVVTVASKPTTVAGDVRTSEPQASRVIAENAPCGDGAVAGIGLSLYLAQERVAASVTDAGGDVAFIVPDWVTGPLTLVVDSVPPGPTTILPGQVVGTVRVEPAPKTEPW